MPLAVLVAGELVSGRRPQPPAPSVALNPIRTRWMEHLGRRPPCLRIMPFRTSCGRPDPAAVAGLRDHDQVCPALSGPQRSRHSRCHLTATALIQARQMPQEAASEARLRDRDKRGLPVALNPTLMIWPGRLARPTACPRIMFFHSSCGSPNSAAGVVCGGLRPACPALSRPRLSPWSRCRAIRINSARGLTGLTRKPPATAPANKRPMPRAAPSPTRTACLVPVPRLPVACRRTMPFRTSCGPPNPAAVAGLRDHDRVCPALSGPQRSQKSKCRAIHTVTRATPPRGARATVMNNGTQIPRKTRGPQAVASPIPMI